MRYPRIRGVGLVAAGLVAACAPVPADVPAPDPAPAGPPPPLAERALEFPPYEERRLPNGLRILVVERAVQPVASATMYLPAGSYADPVERTGLASLVAEVLTKGTPDRTAEEIAETIEGVGGSLSASAGADNLSVSTTVLSDRLPLALDLIADVVRRPTFPEREVETARTRALSGLRAAMGQPQEVARRHFIATVYGPDHPYGSAPVEGTLAGIERDHLVAFHREQFSPRNALLVVAGDVRVGEVEALAQRYFGDWSGPDVPDPAFPEPPAREAMRIHLVHRPGTVQSNVWIGHVGIRPDNPDYFPLQVMNRIVGGGVDARLFQILREEKGWTYGAYSSFTRPLDIGHFAARAEVRTEVTDSATAEMLRQLRRIREEEVPAEEFESARSYLAGSFPLRIETAGQIASQLAQIRLLGLPDDYVTGYRQRILAVTPEDVRRVAREYVRPDRAVVVVVADATRVLEGLEAIGPVSLHDVEGAPLPREELGAAAAPVARDGTRLVAGRRIYGVAFQGSPMGTVTHELAREGDLWTARSRMESPLLEQETDATFAVADLAPVASRVRIASGGMRVDSDLRMEDGRLLGRIEAPEAAGGDRDVDTELPPGTLLPGMDEFALAVADLGPDARLSLSLFDATTGEATTISYRVTGEETVTVPAGTFETYRVQVAGANPMTVFLRRDAPHIAVRQEWDAAPVVIELQELEEG